MNRDARPGAPALILWPLLVCLLALVSCRSVQPAALGVRTADEPGPRAERDEPIDKSVDERVDERAAESRRSIWPDRWGDDPARRGVVVEIDHPIDELGVAHLSRNHRLRIGPTEYADAAALAEGLGMEEPHRFRAEGPGCFIFARRELDEPVENEDPPDLLFKFVSAQAIARSTGAVVGGSGPEDHIEIERTWFTYRRPLNGSDPKGVLVLMPGMFGTPEPIVDASERYFRASGWSVLRMLAHPSRFTQRETYEIPDDPARQGLVSAAIARDYDSRTAECAYAVDAALGFVGARRARDLDAPVVLMGMSGGAMALPTVFAYAPERYDAAVLIAGGGNFLEISARSNYTKWIDAIEFDADPIEEGVQPLVGELLERVSDRYLTHARLDALQTAPALASVPTLVLHADRDRAVPASTGEALHRALGEPERWVYAMGHELIFLTLPTQIPKIESWAVDRVID